MTIVVGFGEDIHGQDGCGYFQGTLITSPVQAGALPSTVTAIATGGGMSFTLQKNGSVLAFGVNEGGQLGNGLNNNKGAPNEGERLGKQPLPSEPLGLPHDVVAISAAGGHAVVLKSDGKVATWGQNLWGQIGNGQGGEGHEDGGGFAASPVYLSLTGIVSVASGSAVCAAVNAAGEVAMWGENNHGQCGSVSATKQITVPTWIPNFSGVKQVAIGGLASNGAHTLFLKTDGTVWACGAGAHGELAQGVEPPGGTNKADRTTPVAVIGLPAGITQVFAGFHASYALDSAGNLYAWGANERGGLATGVLDEIVVTPKIVMTGVTTIDVGFNFFLAICNSKLYGCGRNNEAALGDGTETDKLLPVEIPALTGVKAVSAGEQHSLAICNSKGLPAPLLTGVGGKGEISVSWESDDTINPFHLAIRPAEGEATEYGENVKVEPNEPKVHTFSGLTAGAYEVEVYNLATWGRRTGEYRAS